MIDHACDDNGNNVLNMEEEADVTCINYINETNDISMNDVKHFIHKYYAPFYRQRIMKVYHLYHNMIQKEEDFVVIKTLFWIYYSINQTVFNGRYYCYFFL